MCSAISIGAVVAEVASSTEGKCNQLRGTNRPEIVVRKAMKSTSKAMSIKQRSREQQTGTAKSELK